MVFVMGTFSELERMLLDGAPEDGPVPFNARFGAVTACELGGEHIAFKAGVRCVCLCTHVPVPRVAF